MMKLHTRVYAYLAVLSAFVLCASLPAAAQQKDHGVSAQELRQDVQGASDKRHANEAAIRELLSTEQGQKALKSANVDFQKMNGAVSQLSDEEAARLAAESRTVQKDIAAGNFSDRDLLIVVVVVALLVLVIVAVR